MDVHLRARVREITPTRKIVGKIDGWMPLLPSRFFFLLFLFSKENRVATVLHNVTKIIFCSRRATRWEDPAWRNRVVKRSRSAMTAAYKLHAAGRFLRISRYSTCVLTYLRVIIVQGRGREKEGEGGEVDMRNIIACLDMEWGEIW